MTPEEKEYVKQDLVGYIVGTVDEWLRLADLEISKEGQARQYRISWEHPTDGAMIANVSEDLHGDPIARFGIQIVADVLPDLPPIGPENDLGVYGIDEAPKHAGADGECPHYGSELDPCPSGCASGTCVYANEACLNCAPLLAGASSTRVDGTDGIARDCEHGEEWMPATFGDVLPGDRIRLGQEETEVRKAHRGRWHARSRQWVDDQGKARDHQTPWEHEELRLDLAAVPGMRVYQPDLECEIFCDAERASILLLQRGFPGSTVVSS